MTERTVILSGVIGSRAYGLATPDSDTDRLGVFVYPTEILFRVDALDMPFSYVTHDPDVTEHEARKFAKLALKCNPTITELLWLNEYEIMEFAGAKLVELRTAFLSKRYVRDAYLGYATQQFKRLETRGDLARGTKHARHLLRLLLQGYGLYKTGELQVKCENPEWVAHTAIEMYHDLDLTRQILQRYEDAFEGALSPLPDEADFDRVNNWLVETRKEYYV